MQLEDCEWLRIDILRIDRENEDFIRYTSTDGESVFALAEIYDFHLETDLLSAGENDLFIYDRGLVSGQIPLTRFRLNHLDVSRLLLARPRI